MMFTLDQARIRVPKKVEKLLEEVLNASSPDGDSWQAGEKAFYDAYRKQASLDKCFWEALDQSAPDKPYWSAGRDIYLSSQDAIGQEPYSSLVERIANDQQKYERPVRFCVKIADRFGAYRPQHA